MISHHFGLVYLHVPRTAGWSFTEAVKSQDPYVEFPGGWHGLPEDHASSLHYYTAMVIRNPWDRLVSLNHYLTGGGKAVPMWNFIEQCKLNRAGGRAVWLEPSAEPWWHPDVDLVAKFEDVVKDPSVLFQYMGEDAPPECFRLQHLHKNEDRLPYEAYYTTQAEIDAVAELCSWELMHGYTF